MLVGRTAQGIAAGVLRSFAVEFSGGRTLARKQTRLWVRDESGQSLVLVIVSMTVIIGIAAFAIDVAGWFVTRHHAQVAADAAALAAANQMATDQNTGTATAVGQNFVAKNGLDNSTATVSIDTTSYTVTVTVPTTGSVGFAGALGVGSPKISARAVASYLSGTTPDALFAASSNCSSGISFAGNGNGSANNLSLTGGVHSNGSLLGGIGGGSTIGAMTFGTGCSNQLGSIHGTVSVAPYATTNTATWPVPYDSSSCTLQNGTSCYFNPASACSSSNGGYTAGSVNPPAGITSTLGSSNITITGNVGSSQNPVVLCAPNGTITLNGGSGTAIHGTLYASTFAWSTNGATITPPSDDLGIYYSSGVTSSGCSGGTGLNLDGNNLSLNSAYVYAPCQSVTVYHNNGTGFIEAQSISISGNNWTFAGSGPIAPGDYGDSLIQ